MILAILLTALIALTFSGYHHLRTRIKAMAASQSDVLAALAALSAKVDAIVVPVATPPVDEQPVLDAVSAVSAKLDAKFPPAT